MQKFQEFTEILPQVYELTGPQVFQDCVVMNVEENSVKLEHIALEYFPVQLLQIIKIIRNNCELLIYLLLEGFSLILALRK